MTPATRASGLLFGLNAAVAYLVVAPFAEVVATIVRRHPDGDAALLFAPGGTYLLDWVMRLRDVAPALARTGSLLLLVWFVAGIAIEGGALAILDRDARGAVGEALSRGVAAFWRLAALTAGALLLEALLIAFGLAAASRIGARWSDLPARAFAVGLVSATPFALGAAWVRSAGDLARATVIHGDAGSLDALRGPLEQGAEVTRLLVRSAPRWLASVGAIGFAAAFTSSVDRVALVVVAHTLVTLAQVRLRVSVLALSLDSARTVEARFAADEEP